MMTSLSECAKPRMGKKSIPSCATNENDKYACKTEQSTQGTECGNQHRG